MTVKQKILDMGMNVFGLQLFCESLLKAVIRDSYEKPIEFEFPISRKDTPGYIGVRCRFEPVAERAGDSEPTPTISDGFGSTWSKVCPDCNRETMHVVRPGKVQCGHCS